MTVFFEQNLRNFCAKYFNPELLCASFPHEVQQVLRVFAHIFAQNMIFLSKLTKIDSFSTESNMIRFIQKVTYKEILIMLS